MVKLLSLLVVSVFSFGSLIAQAQTKNNFQTQSVSNMSADNSHRNKVFPKVLLSAPVQGQRAVEALGSKLPEVAAWYGMTPQEFSGLMRRDRATRLDREGRLFYADDFALNQIGADLPGDLNNTNIPYSETFLLHSKPRAKRVIYLDFGGQVVTGTAWNTSTGLPEIIASAYSRDADPQFNTEELTLIQRVWQIVAEDYAPFDVDVTTEYPGHDALTRSSPDDEYYGSHVLITNNTTNEVCQGCGGIAYVGTFNFQNSYYYQPAFVFSWPYYSSKVIADIASHESGHNLGLHHDGKDSLEYYSGHGSGETGWGPIMGSGYFQSVTQWSKGEYSGASNQEDDFVVMQRHGLSTSNDDHADGRALATVLDFTSDEQELKLRGSGIIETPADQDMFHFTAGFGDISFTVTPAATGANLDIGIALYDSSGSVLATSNPIDTLRASFVYPNAPAGEYYLMVEGVGMANPLVADVGYTDYGSLGIYNIFGTAVCGSGVDGCTSAENQALQGTANQSSTGYGGVPKRAIDGNTDGNYRVGSTTHTNYEPQPWWQVDLGVNTAIEMIRWYNRTNCCSDRLKNLNVFVSDTPFGAKTLAELKAEALTNPNLNHEFFADVQPDIGQWTQAQQGRYVRLQLEGTGYLSLAEVRVHGVKDSTPTLEPTEPNVATDGTASQSSTGYGGVPKRAIDGNTDGNYRVGSTTHTNYESQPWWQVDLGADTAIEMIRWYNRTDCCSDRLKDLNVFVSDTPFGSKTLAELKADPDVNHQFFAGVQPNLGQWTQAQQGRYVRLQLEGTGYLSLAEVQVFGRSSP